MQNSSFPEAPRLASLGPSRIQSTSKGLMLSDKLQPCESQERPSALARPSGLRLPSPSLRLFDQVVLYFIFFVCESISILQLSNSICIPNGNDFRYQLQSLVPCSRKIFNSTWVLTEKLVSYGHQQDCP